MCILPYLESFDDKSNVFAKVMINTVGSDSFMNMYVTSILSPSSSSTLPFISRNQKRKKETSLLSNTKGGKNPNNSELIS